MFLILQPPFLFLFLSFTFFFFLSLFLPQGGMRKNNFNLVLYQISENALWWKPAHAVSANPEKREDLSSLKLDACGALALFRLSVTAPDLGRDNMWVSQVSISLSAGWDIRAGLLLEKASNTVFCWRCAALAPIEWVCSKAETICQSVS